MPSNTNAPEKDANRDSNDIVKIGGAEVLNACPYKTDLSGIPRALADIMKSSCRFPRTIFLVKYALPQNPIKTRVMTGKAIWYNKSTSFAKKVSGGGTLLMPPEGK